MLSDRSHPRHFLPLLLILLAVCADPIGSFTKGRALDPCNGTNYAVCDTIAGCILDNTNYLQGHFPGQEDVLVRTTGPATVQLSFYLTDVTSSGMETLLTWYEPGCTARHQESVIGSVFVGEAEKTGEFTRSYDLLAAGDHRITYQSDSNCNYYFKVSVIPK